jgi:hypothetical protein
MECMKDLVMLGYGVEAKRVRYMHDMSLSDEFSSHAGSSQ